MVKRMRYIKLNNKSAVVEGQLQLYPGLEKRVLTEEIRIVARAKNGRTKKTDLGTRAGYILT
jgi:hypothetical protein